MSRDWRRYFDAAGLEPRETLLQALERFEREGAAPGRAVDLGCGTGRDTLELLRRGWRVLAVDGEAEAVRRLLARPEAAAAGERLRTQVARFEEARWPRVELVNASFSLPFCPPASFGELWGRVVASLREGGRFCGQLFGVRDEWAGERDLTFLTREEAEALLRGFELERFDEVEEDGETAVGDRKHWHLFHVVARRYAAR